VLEQVEGGVQQQPEQDGGVCGTEHSSMMSVGKRGRGRPAVLLQQHQQVRAAVGGTAVEEQPVRGGQQGRGARGGGRRAARSQ
jgi:hypothetical protein